MHWNYRVLRFEETFHEGQSVQREEWYEIVEVYYDDEGEPMFFGRRTLSAEDLNGLQEMADRMLKAVSKPVLEATIFDEPEV
jgi:cobalamin biosynthesis Mg chelatase CobN